MPSPGGMILQLSLIALVRLIPTHEFTIAPQYSNHKLLMQKSDVNGNDCNDVDVLKLNFNMLKLIPNDVLDLKEQGLKMQCLEGILQACRCSIVDVSEQKDTLDVVAAEQEQYTLPEELARLRRFICTSPHVDDHRGNFQVFTKSSISNKQSLPSNILSSITPNMFSFLRDSLSFTSPSSKHKKGGMMYDYSEAVVWCSKCCDSNEKLEYASKVLDDMPFAHLYLGTTTISEGRDHHVLAELDFATLRALESLGVLIMDGENDQREDQETERSIKCELRCADIDIIETMLLSCINHVDRSMEKEQQTLLKLIESAVESVRRDPLNESNQPQLVLIADSISASKIAASISTWKGQQLQSSTRRIENLLNQALTVLTFGNLCREFPRGPAYIHVCMYDDPWTKSLGATSARPSPEHDNAALYDAVYFHALSPFEYDRDKLQTTASICNLKSHNAHNSYACTIQFLALIMRINGIQSFRALYDAAKFNDPLQRFDINPRHFAVNCKLGDLVIPPNIDNELLPAMVQASGGEMWLWKDDNSAEFGSLVPCEIEAVASLEESFGYSAHEEIVDTCSSPKN